MSGGRSVRRGSSPTMTQELQQRLGHNSNPRTHTRSSLYRSSSLRVRPKPQTISNGVDRPNSLVLNNNTPEREIQHQKIPDRTKSVEHFDRNRSHSLTGQNGKILLSRSHTIHRDFSRKKTPTSPSTPSSITTPTSLNTPTSPSTPILPNRPIRAMSLCDVMSASSISSRRSSRENIASRLRKEQTHRRHCDLDEEEGEFYLTPLQRKEREVKMYRKEIIRLETEIADRDNHILDLRCELEASRRRTDEMWSSRWREEVELWEKKVRDLEISLESSERGRFEESEEMLIVKEDLAKVEEKYTELQRQIKEKEEKFTEYYLDMYKKGQMVAQFEREEELSATANSKKSRTTIKELSDKLAKTEAQLARWQNLRLEEVYSEKSGTPNTDAGVTICFLKDAFFHFLCDDFRTAEHLRAIVNILDYSGEQMNKIRQSLAEEKLFKNDVFKKK